MNGAGRGGHCGTVKCAVGYLSSPDIRGVVGPVAHLAGVPYPFPLRFRDSGDWVPRPSAKEVQKNVPQPSLEALEDDDPPAPSCDDRLQGCTDRSMTANDPPKDVVYLFGAGATHACIKSVGNPNGLLMSDLNEPLAEELNDLVRDKYPGDENLFELVNTVVGEHTDFEHVITFLDNAPSMLHRQFAEDLRKVFEQVLRAKLRAVKEDESRNPVDLYTALFDLHRLLGDSESIRGILTTNYDSYVEEALEAAGYDSVDLGFYTATSSSSSIDRSIKLLKLHGSFDWQDTWPVTVGGSDRTLWIPPGIQKDKQRYPFNVIWGVAREVLACDVLRVVGCKLGGNDWDLISLLFTTMHAQSEYKPYRVEIIDAPRNALELGAAMPYLDPVSILELAAIGERLVSEWTGGAPRTFNDMKEEEKESVVTRAGVTKNWFEIWLRHRAEILFEETGTLATSVGAVEDFLER